jgi:cytochrome P450
MANGSHVTLDFYFEFKDTLPYTYFNNSLKIKFFKALDTTSVAISTTLLMLAMHKDIQDKVVSELQHVFTSYESEISYENLFELRYLEMVINETMRLVPVVPFIVRAVDEDMNFGGYEVPSGANLFIAIMKVHRDVKYWGEDANVFKPERFERESFEKIHPYAYLPFASRFSHSNLILLMQFFGIV